MSAAWPRRVTVLVCASVALPLLIAAQARAATTSPYVSLGDSYTAAPLVPNPTGNPIGCGRSTNNYPSDVARARSVSSFTDASCSSATTANMTQSQSVPFGGTNPPQFNSLSSVGHDACQDSGVAWVNGIVPTSVGFRCTQTTPVSRTWPTRC
jgi:hypothetical protein